MQRMNHTMNHMMNHMVNHRQTTIRTELTLKSVATVAVADTDRQSMTQ